jgi:hypothetical protein
MTHTTARALLVVVALAAAACRKGGDASKPAPAASASASAAETAVAPPAVAPARCRAAEAALAVPDAEDLDLGDAVAFAEGYAVALAHRTAAGRVAGVALVPRDLATARVVDLGPILGVGRRPGWPCEARSCSRRPTPSPSAPTRASCASRR